MKLAVTIDGVKKDEMPSSPKISDDNYYKVEVECPNSDTMAEWDYNAWKLKLSYVESNSKCTLKFTSGMTKSDYDEYIKSGVALRRNTYRGKNITELWKSGDLYKQIENGTFDDIYVGDYIKGNNGVTWLIADLDNYLYNGRPTALTEHHATIIPKDNLTYAPMYTDANNDTYLASDMKTKTLPEVLTKYIEPDFNDHIIEYMYYDYNYNGEVSEDASYVSSKVDLMNSMNVLGTSFDRYNVGSNMSQYAIFNLQPYYIWNVNYGLSDIFSKGSYLLINTTVLTRSSKDTLVGVRPRFLID